MTREERILSQVTNMVAGLRSSTDGRQTIYMHGIAYPSIRNALKIDHLPKQVNLKFVLCKSMVNANALFSSCFGISSYDPCN